MSFSGATSRSAKWLIALTSSNNFPVDPIVSCRQIIMSHAKHSSVSCLQSHLTSVSPRVTLAATSRMTIISEGGWPCLAPAFDGSVPDVQS